MGAIVLRTRYDEGTESAEVVTSVGSTRRDATRGEYRSVISHGLSTM